MTGSTISSKSKFKRDLDSLAGKVWSAVLTSIWKASAALLAACCLLLATQLKNASSWGSDYLLYSAVLCSHRTMHCNGFISFLQGRPVPMQCIIPHTHPNIPPKMHCVLLCRVHKDLFHNFQGWQPWCLRRTAQWQHLYPLSSYVEPSLRLVDLSLWQRWQMADKITPTLNEASIYVLYVYLDWLFSVTIALNEMKRMHILKNCFSMFQVQLGSWELMILK